MSERIARVLWMLAGLLALATFASAFVVAAAGPWAVLLIVALLAAGLLAAGLARLTETNR